MDRTFPESNETLAARLNILGMKRDFSSGTLDRLASCLTRQPFDKQVYKKNESRFDTSHVAWMAGGMWNDGQQAWPVNAFHPHFHKTRSNTHSREQRKAVRQRLLECALDMVSD